jgi:hypothetical protein
VTLAQLVKPGLAVLLVKQVERELQEPKDRLVLRDHKEKKETLGLQAPPAQPDLGEHRATKVILGRREHKATKAIQEPREQQAFAPKEIPAHKDLQDLRVILAQLDPKVFRVSRAYKDFQAHLAWRRLITDHFMIFRTNS